MEQKKRRALSVPTVLFKLNSNNNMNKSDKRSESVDTDGSSTSYSLHQSTSNASKPTMTSKQALQLRSTMVPYRENGVLKYMQPPSASAPSYSPSASSSNRYGAHDQISLASANAGRDSSSSHELSLNFAPNMYDSDLEPLILGTEAESQLDDDAMMRFTATGRPMPIFKPSALANLGGHLFIAPQHLPQRYTDESIIPVIVKLNHPVAGVPVGLTPTSRRKSFLGKFKGEKEGGNVKVVYMPRGEYLKYFARDQYAQYVGTEPEQEWTEASLEEKYGKYKKFQA